MQLVYFAHHDLLRQLLMRNLAARYKGSALGLIWSFAHPLMMLGVYTFVFGIVFKARWGVDHFGDSRAAFPLIMFCGMAVFNVFSESVNNSTSLIANNSGLVKKVIFPSLVFGMAWFALLLTGTAIFLHQVLWTTLLLPLLLFPLLLLSSGVCFFIASLGVYLRDIQQVVGIITQVLFFMTPIFYPASIVPESVRWILELNPLSPIVEQTHNVLLFGVVPDFWPTVFMWVVSGIIFQLGLAWFMKTKKGFADVL